MLKVNVLKCPLFYTFLLFLSKFCFLCSSFLKYLVEWQTVYTLIISLIWVCTVCICHFVRPFGVRNFRMFTYYRYPMQGNDCLHINYYTNRHEPHPLPPPPTPIHTHKLCLCWQFVFVWGIYIQDTEEGLERR